jgi:hypothetical protein
MKNSLCEHRLDEHRPEQSQAGQTKRSAGLWCGWAVWLSATIVFVGCSPKSSQPIVDVQAKIAELADASTAGKTGNLQLPWNFRPYVVKIWLVPDGQPRWNDRVLPLVNQDLIHQLRLIEPAAWQVQSEVVPAAWRQRLERWRLDLRELPDELYDEMAGVDKLVLIRLEDTGQQIQYRLNELDINGWSLGPSYAGTAAELPLLASLLADTTKLAFRPIVRLEHSAGDIVTARVRAAGLMMRPVEVGSSDAEASGETSGESALVPDRSSPCWIEDGEIFEPVMREANRQRKFELKKIEPLDFTLLVQQGVVEDQYVKAKVVSVNRGDVALGRKKGRNFERIGIVVRTPPATTTIRLFTKRGTSAKDLQEFPLNGYQIYSRSIFGTEDSFEYLGKTDWNGRIEIAPGDERVRLLLVKNGERNLARLPVMPGTNRLWKNCYPMMTNESWLRGLFRGSRAKPWTCGPAGPSCQNAYGWRLKRMNLPWRTASMRSTENWSASTNGTTSCPIMNGGWYPVKSGSRTRSVPCLPN